MISIKQWSVLFLFYIICLLIGAAFFLLFEEEHERNSIAETQQQLRTLQLASANFINELDNESTKESGIGLLEEIGSFCDTNFIEKTDFELVQSLLSLKYDFEKIEGFVTQDVERILENGEREHFQLVKEDEVEEKRTWTLWNSFFFTFSCITTIGWGHMFPNTEGGQIFSIFYSLIGLPLNCILFSGLADIFGSKMLSKHTKSDRYQNKVLVLVDVVWYLVPGLVVLMVLPSGLFCYMEGWTYTESFYYAFISLTTIGFGDLVAGRPETEYGTAAWLYKGAIFVWIVFGLGYLLMVVGILQKGLKSQEIRQLDRKVAKILKKKAGNMNLNMRNDLERIRNILNTINFLQAREKIYNDNHVMTDESAVSKSETGNSVLKRTSSDPNVFQEKVYVEQIESSNATVFMDIAESILHQQEIDKERKTTGLNHTMNSGPESSHSDPYPSLGTHSNNISEDGYPTKIKSDSYLSKKPGDLPHKHSDKMEKMKGPFNSYNNPAYDMEEGTFEISSVKDVESIPDPEELPPPLVRTNKRLSQIKDYIVGKLHLNEPSEQDQNKNTETEVESPQCEDYTLSHLLGQMETVLVEEAQHLHHPSYLHAKRRFSCHGDLCLQQFNGANNDDIDKLNYEKEHYGLGLNKSCALSKNRGSLPDLHRNQTIYNLPEKLLKPAELRKNLKELL